MGKAATKQARTLELEFTLAPRSSESKGRVGRRVGSRPPDSNSSNIVVQSTPRLIGGTSTSADIRNPEEFPSLSTVSSGPIATKTRINSSDSLAQKLAKSNRFTVKNVIGSQDHDEFPSLMAESSSTDQEVKDDRKFVEKPNGTKPSARPRFSQDEFLMSGNSK